MLKLIGTAIKVSLFAIVVLIAANWIKLDGSTVSDQVKYRMAQATHTVGHWTEKLDQMPAEKEKPRAAVKATQDQISHTEREKLRALIRELNSPKKDKRSARN